jgi:aerobic carbon-monoxide dehydrogenase large subunit
LALDLEGNFLALRTETMANVGAYLSNFSTVTPTFLHGTLMAGPYKTPLVYVNVKAVFTNTAPVDAYRGAGRPEATYSIERVVDKAVPRAEARSHRDAAQELHPAGPVPLYHPGGLVYDTGNYPPRWTS